MHSILTAALFLLSVSPASRAIPIMLTQEDIELAGGGPPNSNVTTLSADDTSALQLSNYLENLEFTFFSQGAAQFTQDDYDLAGFAGNTEDIIRKLAAQEKVHIATIENVLLEFNQSTIDFCEEYSFPFNNAGEFLSLANVITNVGVGVLIAALQVFEDNVALIRDVGSIVTVETRHDAFLRIQGKQFPNPTPFDTQIAPIWAYNLAQQFIVNCSHQLDLPIIPPMGIIGGSTTPSFTSFNGSDPRPTIIQFSFDPSKQTTLDMSVPIFVGFANQADDVLYEVGRFCGYGCVEVDLPTTLHGTVYAALTHDTPPDVQTLSTQTLAGPVPVLID